jgi:hypothetical protein
MIPEIFAQAIAVDPSVGWVATSIGILGVAILHVYERWLAIANAAEATRQASIVTSLSEGQIRLEAQLWVKQTQLEECGRETAMWRARCESLGWSPKSSPPKSDHA